MYAAARRYDVPIDGGVVALGGPAQLRRHFTDGARSAELIACARASCLLPPATTAWPLA